MKSISPATFAHPRVTELLLGYRIITVKQHIDLEPAACRQIHEDPSKIVSVELSQVNFSPYGFRPRKRLSRKWALSTKNSQWTARITNA